MKMPENTFELLPSSMPQLRDLDPYGDILLFSKKIGWIVTKFEEIEAMAGEYECTHWTYTPDIPPI